MKTILIAHNYEENSFSVMSYSLAHFLLSEGYRVIFLSHKPYFKTPKIIKKAKGEIVVLSWVNENRPTGINNFIWFLKIYLKYKPSLIIGHFVGSNISAIVSKILSLGKSKVFVYYHTLSKQLLIDNNLNSYTYTFKKYRKMFFYKCFTDTIICPSNLAKEDLENHFNIKKSTVVVNPMKDRFTKNIKLSSDKIIISFLGRLDESKGVCNLLNTFDVYFNQNPSTCINLQIAGSGVLKNKVYHFSVKYNQHVKFVGGLNYMDVDNYLKKSHYVIIPSIHDAFNVVGIEALMNETPVLISNATGVSNYLVDGYDCYKFDSDNEDDMLRIIAKVENNFNHNVMRKNARKTFEEKFSLDKYYKNIIALF